MQIIEPVLGYSKPDNSTQPPLVPCGVFNAYSVISSPSSVVSQWESQRETYTWKLDATVTALGRGTLLLDVEVPELAAGSLDDAGQVGLGVVGLPPALYSKKPSVSTTAATTGALLRGERTRQVDGYPRT